MRNNALERFRGDSYFDWPPDPACLGCRYYRPVHDHGKERLNTGLVCHYLLDTGTMRGCPFGEGCTRFEV